MVLRVARARGDASRIAPMRPATDQRRERWTVRVCLFPLPLRQRMGRRTWTWPRESSDSRDSSKSRTKQQAVRSKMRRLPSVDILQLHQPRSTFGGARSSAVLSREQKAAMSGLSPSRSNGVTIRIKETALRGAPPSHRCRRTRHLWERYLLDCRL
jgi:hypothetical protein